MSSFFFRNEFKSYTFNVKVLHSFQVRWVNTCLYNLPELHLKLNLILRIYDLLLAK